MTGKPRQWRESDDQRREAPATQNTRLPNTSICPGTPERGPGVHLDAAALEEPPEADQQEEPKRDRKRHHLRTEKVATHVSIVHLSMPARPIWRARHVPGSVGHIVTPRRRASKRRATRSPMNTQKYVQPSRLARKSLTAGRAERTSPPSSATARRRRSWRASSVSSQ